MSKEAKNYCSNELIDCHRLDENEEINQWDNHYIITPEQLQAYADECVEKNNEEWRKTLKDIGKLKQIEK